MTLRGALIGCGYASWFQLTGWANVDGAEIVSVSSRDRQKVKARASEFAIPSVYTDYREMLDDEAFDFVDIATPPGVHLEMVTEVARRGLPVLCQKPIAPTLGDLREMIRVCNEAGVAFVVNENGRFLPWFRRIKALLSEGAIGRPYYVNFTDRARASLPELNFGGQPFFADMPQLITFEMGVHYLDTLRYLFGEADTLHARMQQVSPHIAGEDIATLTLQIGDVTAVVDMSWASVPTWDSGNKVAWGECRVEGTAGTLHLGVDGVLRLITDRGEERFTHPTDSETLSYQAAQQNFTEGLVTATESETSGRETLKTMELVFGAYYSAEHDRVYRIGEDLGRLA